MSDIVAVQVVLRVPRIEVEFKEKLKVQVAFIRGGKANRSKVLTFVSPAQTISFEDALVLNTTLSKQDRTKKEALIQLATEIDRAKDIFKTTVDILRFLVPNGKTVVLSQNPFVSLTYEIQVLYFKDSSQQNLHFQSQMFTSQIDPFTKKQAKSPQLRQSKTAKAITQKKSTLQNKKQIVSPKKESPEKYFKQKNKNVKLKEIKQRFQQQQIFFQKQIKQSLQDQEKFGSNKGSGSDFKQSQQTKGSNQIFQRKSKHRSAIQQSSLLEKLQQTERILQHQKNKMMKTQEMCVKLKRKIAELQSYNETKTFQIDALCMQNNNLKEKILSNNMNFSSNLMKQSKQIELENQKRKFQEQLQQSVQQNNKLIAQKAQLVQNHAKLQQQFEANKAILKKILKALQKYPQIENKINSQII